MLALKAVPPIALPMTTGLRFRRWFKMIGRQVIAIAVTDENNTTTASAITTVRSSFGDKFFAAKAQAAVAAMASLQMYFSFIDEHSKSL
jgi:hypothetical protein